MTLDMTSVIFGGAYVGGNTSGGIAMLALPPNQRGVRTLLLTSVAISIQFAVIAPNTPVV
jgi:hypothetical protein